jgi:hypothetical protein
MTPGVQDLLSSVLRSVRGHPRYGGRRKGSRNRFGGDLREEVVAAIQETGFIEKDDKGNPIATGEGGCKDFIKWWHCMSRRRLRHCLLVCCRISSM